MTATELLAIQNPPDRVQDRTSDIREAVLRESAHLDDANFTVIHPDDLENLFRRYDDAFFGGWLARTVTSQTCRPLRPDFDLDGYLLEGSDEYRRQHGAPPQADASRIVAVHRARGGRMVIV